MAARHCSPPPPRRAGPPDSRAGWWLRPSTSSCSTATASTNPRSAFLLWGAIGPRVPSLAAPLAILPSCTSCLMRTWRRCVVCDACLPLEFNLLLVLVLLAVTSLLFSRSFCVNSQNSSHIPLSLSLLSIGPPLSLALSRSVFKPTLSANLCYLLPSPPLCLSLFPPDLSLFILPAVLCDRSLHVSPSSDAYPR